MTGENILKARGKSMHRRSPLAWQVAFAALLAAGCQSGSSAAPADAKRPFTVAEVAKFSTPWAIDFLPGSGVRLTMQALVSEKEGSLWIVNVDTGEKSAVEVDDLVDVAVAGQGGLGDVVVDPDFAANSRVYLSYVEKGPNGTSGAALGYGQLIASSTGHAKLTYRLANFKVIWRQSPKVSGNGHFAHRIAFGPDGLLYLTSGDRQKFTPAQDLSGNLGKVLRLTAEGLPAPGNPWASRGGVAAQFWTIGHRNALGIAFAPDKRLWVSEMGPEGGDEINLIVAGKNYGWPRASNGSNYGAGDIPDHKAGDGFEPPKVYWTPSISPGGLMIYSGDKFPAWKGDALVPALSGEALIRVDLKGDRAAKAEQWPMDARIRSVEQGPEGSVYLLEDGRGGSGGRLIRLDPQVR